jgi:hypothetical protein
MNLYTNTSRNTSGSTHTSVSTRRRVRRFSASAAAIVTVSALMATTPSGAVRGSGHRAPAPARADLARVHAARAERPAYLVYPVGVRDAKEPSGVAPPPASALPGYRRTYKTDFNGATLPAGWGTFNGVPQGDNQSQWLPSHVVVSGGVVRLIASRDAALRGRWVTGGISQYSVHRTYGAYFIRSRVTGPGPDQNEMLWPAAPVWPPEVDFNEMGYSTGSTSWTVHYGHGAKFVQTTRAFNMERWHTWGLIWTPRKMTFTIDGRSWGQLTNWAEIPHQQMMLDVQQQVWCQPRLACPSRASAIEIDWVEEFVHR